MYISEGKKYLLRELGAKWKLQVIDLELCVYRDLGNYDIEVSCVNGMKRSKINIYVWQKIDGLCIVERVMRVPIMEAVPILKEIEQRYSDRSAA